MPRDKSETPLSKEEVKQVSKELFDLRFSEWVDRNWDNPDAYEYEKTFDTMIKGCLQEIMQLAAGPAPKDKNLKKN